MTLAKTWKRTKAPKVKVPTYTDLIGAELTPERVFKLRLAHARVWTVDALEDVLMRQLAKRYESFATTKWVAFTVRTWRASL